MTRLSAVLLAALLPALRLVAALPGSSPNYGILRRATSPDGSCGLIQAGSNHGYTCTTGNCCSQYGWCGNSADHCGTGCQPAYGICNGVTTTTSKTTTTTSKTTTTSSKTTTTTSKTTTTTSKTTTTTSKTTTTTSKTTTTTSKTTTTTTSGTFPTNRAHVGSVPYGVIIENCVVANTVALTFDDGPYIYTKDVLDLLASYGAHATFFVNGLNYDSIYNYADIIKRMVNEGHQVGSHTWDHGDLTTMDANGMTSEMTQLETALKSILGYYPGYMRPPYFSTNSAVLSTMSSLGYHVIQAALDTDDWEQQANIQVSVNNWNAGTDAGQTIELSHDTLEQTAHVLAKAMLDGAKARGKKVVTVGECLGDPKSNWYRTGS